MKESIIQFVNDPSLSTSTALIVLLGAAWTMLELTSYVIVRPFFLRLLDANPRAGNIKKKAQTATQMLPRLVCFVHNSLQIPAAFVILLSQRYYSQRMWAGDSFSRGVMAISAGYFLYDTAECLIRFEHEGWDFLLHGVFCLAVFTNLTLTGVMHYYGAGFLLWELSTPFMHLRWVLYKLGKENSSIYTLNALAGIAVFFFARILWGNALSLIFWRDSLIAGAGPRAAELPMPTVWFYRLCTLVMNGLNAWWFSKMLRILLSAVREARAGHRNAAAAAEHDGAKAAGKAA